MVQKYCNQLKICNFHLLRYLIQSGLTEILGGKRGFLNFGTLSFFMTQSLLEKTAVMVGIKQIFQSEM